MRFSVATAFSALVALAAAHTDPDYTKDPSGNAITSPGLNEIVPEGKSYTIKWTPTTEGPISLVLLRGPSTNVQPLKTLAEQIPNSGEFKWTPGSDLTPTPPTTFGLGAAAGSSASSGSGSGSASTIEVTESTTICPETETAGPTATAKPSTVVAETTETTTFCPESETASAVTTTICPETETASATSIPVVVPTGVSPVTSKAWTSSARASTVAPSGTASASPAASSPVFNGAASNTFSLGAVFAGLFVAFAI
ncbi:unnamed protein product [Penicillium salamii]|nr:unnamed protein product [Penicillium salamii]